jgi:VWFA-related protein
MHLRSKAFLLTLALPLWCATGRGQVNLSRWPLVRVELAGSDDKGDPLQGLTPEMLQITEDGKPVKVVDLKAASDPVSVCLLIDSSGSMYNKKDAVRSAAERLLAKLAPEDEICVADFSVSTFVDQDFTTDRTADGKALTYLKSSGGTAMYEAVEAMAKYMAKNARQPSRAVIVLTDGGDNASKISLTQLGESLKTINAAAVYEIVIPGDDRKKAEREALQLTQSGGGLAFLPRNAADVQDAVDQLADTLKARYMLTYESPNSSKDGQARRVDVELDRVHQKMKAVVRAPEGYYAPSQ